MKETYVQPEVRSETFEPGAFAQSGGGGETGPVQVLFPLFGLCCD